MRPWRRPHKNLTQDDRVFQLESAFLFRNSHSLQLENIFLTGTLIYDVDPESGFESDSEFWIGKGTEYFFFVGCWLLVVGMGNRHFVLFVSYA